MTTFNACEVGLDPPTSKQPLEPDNRLLKIKKLKAKLINEEHRLVLMKKIRQSQTRPVSAQQQASGSGGPNNLGQNSNSNSLKKMRQQALQRSAMAAAAAAAANQTGGISMQRNQQHQLHNPSQSALSKHLYNLSSSTASTSPSSNNQLFNNSSSSSANTSLNQTPAHAHQRPKVNTLWNPPQQARHPTPVGIAPPHVGNLSRQPITTPPNVVQAMIGGAGGQQSLMMGTNNLTTLTTGSNRRQPQLQGTFNNKSQAAQLLLQQKRTAAKTALQKQQPLTTSPNNIVQAMMGGQQSLLMNANNLTPSNTGNTTRRQPQLQGTFNKSQAAQMLLQKRTAAKSAIQKQLEQTLMQLPPKQVQMGIDFVPNANNIEFVYYVGLEACVDYLTSTKNPLDMQPLEKPFECSTCGTDFTPSWSWKRSQAVCENCVGNQVKKSIKNSQSSRIKSVLTKAAKQEQDMDQRIMAEAANVVSTNQPATSTSHQSQQHSLLQPASHQQTRTSSHSNSNNNSSNSNSQIWPRMNASPLNAVSSNTNNNSTSNSSIWSRINASPLTAPNSNRSANVQHPVNPNPLAAMQPAALQSLLQMNPQLSAIASLMSPSNNNNNNNNNNQFAQVAALLMNQLTMNMWNKR